FDANWYLTRNRDVAKTGVDPILHYLLHGGLEGRDPSPYFSTSGYLARYPDVRQAGMNPLLHYLLFGADEGRQIIPSGDFTQDWRGDDTGDVTLLQTVPSFAREQYGPKLLREFEEFLVSGDRLSILKGSAPCISVLVVVHNNAHLTLACVKSVIAASR